MYKRNKNKNKTKKKDNILSYYGINNTNINNYQINYGNQEDNEISKYFTITTPEYTYNVRLDYGEMNNELNIIQQDNDIKECIKLHIPNNKNEKIAYLANVNYYTSCSINFQRNKGTVHMIKTVLKYIIDNYKNIETIHLKDTTAINSEVDSSIIEPFFITLRRLFTNQKGWYEEKCGAIPIDQTISIVDFLKKENKTIQSLIPKNIPKKWWTKQNTLSLIEKINKKTNFSYHILESMLFYTSWTIPRNIVEQYNIVYSINDSYKGGAKEIDHIIKNMKRYIMPDHIKINKICK